MTNFFGLLAALVFSVSLSVGFANLTTFVVPKGYQAKQSSNYSVDENPNFGIDGNRDGTYIAGVQCLHTHAADPLPWWMVDLEINYLIYGALVWNRLDGTYESRFRQVSVGVTSNAVVWTSFNVAQLTLCMYYSSVATTSSNPINFTCPSPIVGRYLAVYKNRTGLSEFNRAHHFCEVDVLAVHNRDSDPSKPYLAPHVRPSFSPASTSLLFNSPFYARSDIECSFLCSNYQSCLFVLHKGVSFQCWMFNDFKISSSFSSIYNSSDSSFVGVYGIN